MIPKTLKKESEENLQQTEAAQQEAEFCDACKVRLNILYLFHL